MREEGRRGKRQQRSRGKRKHVPFGVAYVAHAHDVVPPVVRKHSQPSAIPAVKYYKQTPEQTLVVTRREWTSFQAGTNPALAAFHDSLTFPKSRRGDDDPAL